MCATALRSEVFGRSTSASPCPVPLRLRLPWSSAPPVPGRFSPRPLWHSLLLWRSRRASSCAQAPWSSATSVLNRSAWSFLALSLSCAQPLWRSATQRLWRPATLALSYVGAQSLFWRSATVLALTYYSGAQILLWRSAIALALSNYSGELLLCCRSAVSVLGRVALVLFGARLLSLSALSGANPMALSLSSVPHVLACVCLC
jgi:hypothetical protein